MMMVNSAPHTTTVLPNVLLADGNRDTRGHFPGLSAGLRCSIFCFAKSERVGELLVGTRVGTRLPGDPLFH